MHTDMNWIKSKRMNILQNVKQNSGSSHMVCVKFIKLTQQKQYQAIIV